MYLLGHLRLDVAWCLGLFNDLLVHQLRLFSDFLHQGFVLGAEHLVLFDDVIASILDQFVVVFFDLLLDLSEVVLKAADDLLSFVLITHKDPLVVLLERLVIAWILTSQHLVLTHD